MTLQDMINITVFAIKHPGYFDLDALKKALLELDEDARK